MKKVNYLVLGTVSSEAEFQAVVARIKAAADNRRQVREFVEFLNMVTKSEELGVPHEAKRWKSVAEDGAVQLYVSYPPPGQTGLWAAVAMAADLRTLTLTLLKMTDAFSGGESEHRALLGDALHRKKYGVVIQEQRP